jgi:light-regulated signal transduction histidine kinase (bacteriophytochrome)
MASEDGRAWCAGRTTVVPVVGVGASGFEPFVRLHSSEEYPGTGIGLATVRKAARRMGSEVTVSSVPGEGSTFALELPAATVPETGR